MKMLFVLISFIGMIHVSSGLDTSARGTNPNNDIVGVSISPSMTPRFTQLDGNLFLAIKTEGEIDVEDGDVIEFIFNKKTRLVSFHVNEINQDLINTGNANLFVMIHNDLALTLKSHRLQQINVRHNNDVYTLQVNKFWTPDQYMAHL